MQFDFENNEKLMVKIEIEKKFEKGRYKEERNQLKENKE